MQLTGGNGCVILRLFKSKTLILLAFYKLNHLN